MVRIFNSIRQRLLAQNRFSRYLLYAIGEIFLVVIGILIALQLNNLNDQHKSKKTVQVYYEQLLQDFEVNRNFIEETTAFYDSNSVKLEQYRTSFKQADLPTGQILADLGKLDWLMRSIWFESTTTTTLQSTGDIKLLPAKIREKMVRLRTLQERAVSSSDKNFDLALEMTTYASRFFGSPDFLARLSAQPHLVEYVMQEDRNIQILIALEASINLKEFAESHNLEVFKEILADMEELTGMINEELSK